MSDNKTRVWKSNITQQLAEVLIDITDKQAMQNFLRDVMTEKEITEVSARLEAAKMLTVGNKYIDITKRTKLSSRTVARISDWLNNGCNGYAVALQSINQNHSHILPASAE